MMRRGKRRLAIHPSGFAAAFFAVIICGFAAEARATSMRSASAIQSDSYNEVAQTLRFSSNDIATLPGTTSNALLNVGYASVSPSFVNAGTWRAPIGEAYTPVYVVTNNRRHRHYGGIITAPTIGVATGVPDSGNTLLLLSGAVTALVFLRRRLLPGKVFTR